MNGKQVNVSEDCYEVELLEQNIWRGLKRQELVTSAGSSHGESFGSCRDGVYACNATATSHARAAK